MLAPASWSRPSTEWEAPREEISAAVLERGWGEAIARELTENGLVLRYRGTFVMALFDELAGYANDLGLFAEEIDKAQEARA